MTWTLTTFRKDLTAHLRTAEINAVPFWAPRLTPPLVIVDGAETWLSGLEEKSFDELSQEYSAKATLTLQVTIIAGEDNESARDTLDDLTIRTLQAVSNFTDWDGNTAVSQVFLETQNATYLASRFTVTKEITLEEV